MKKMLNTILAIMTAAALAGCGSSSDSASTYAADSDVNSYAKAEAAPAAEEYYDGYEDYEYEYPSEPMASETTADTAAMGKQAAFDGGNEADPITEEDVESAASEKVNRMLIKNVYMEVESENVDAMVKNVEKQVDELGGYIESNNINNTKYSNSERKTATIVARVPVDRLDGFVNEVEGQSNLLNKNTNAEDVTLRYVDTKAKLESYETEYDRLNELLRQADDLDTIIALEARLSEVRYQIESYGSQLKAMKNQATYSTVTISITQVIEYTPVVVEEKTRLERMRDGFISNCKRVWNGLLDFGVGLVVALPVLLVWLVVIAVIVIIIRLIIKSFRKKHPKKEKPSKQPNPASLVSKPGAQTAVPTHSAQNAQPSDTAGLNNRTSSDDR
ncbi:MAG: DUF4349 domain-containing protein [Lachnospiraceae bacterium]|nr:DUF4349 domain-containing protein [Lachnospiraceae bacterium]